jgi:uncharacterized protein YerC
MPHISSKKLETKDLQKLYSQLILAFETSQNRSSLALFLKEFLTHTEKIMLAKRFAVIYLLSREVPHSYIVDSLHMSPATVARMSLKLEIGKYTFLKKVIKELDESVWDILEKMITLGLPPRAGRGRWKHLFSQK